MNPFDSKIVDFESFEDAKYHTAESLPSQPRKLKHPKRVRTEEQKLARAARERFRYQNLSIEKKKEKNQRSSNAWKEKKEMIDKLLATPARECTPEMLEILKKHMIEQYRRNERGKNRYANMSPEERRRYNSKRSQYNNKKKECLKESFEDAKYHTAESQPSKPRKLKHQKRVRTEEQKLARAARERFRYQNLSIEKKKEKNQRSSNAWKEKKEMIDKLLATPARECTPEMLEILKNHMIEQHRQNERSKNRYANMSPEERRRYNSKRSQYNNNKKKECLKVEEED
uniref:Uncharacterized protein n=1 Tax=Panagrolaimus sp. ES5 TaxID=591445 RepID=A0AC34FKM3_9BILA